MTETEQAAVIKNPETEKEEAKKKEKKKEKNAKKDKDRNRSLEIIYRTASRTHVTMSAIADRKANILLSVSSIINSLAFSFLVARVQDQPAYAFPGLFLIVVCTATAVLAILSTRPVRSKGTFTQDQVRNQETHALFYGNFHKMPFQEYDWAMRQLERNPDYMQTAMHQDLYHLGVAVARKFRFLWWSYTIFMYGMIGVLLVCYFTFEYRISWFNQFFNSLI